MTTPQPPLNGPRRAARTAFQAFVAVCLLAPVLVAQTGLEADQVAWLAPILAVAAAVSRIMALPQVDAFLAAYVPWLAAKPPTPPDPPAPDAEVYDDEGDPHD